MSVHYKFRNEKNSNPVKFDGVYISATELKNKIILQKKLGQSELQLENEETGQAYSDDQQIPKNTNIIVTRLPPANSNKRTRQMANQPYTTNRFGTNQNSSGSTNQNSSGSTNQITTNSTDLGGGREAAELFNSKITKNMTEEEKIKNIQSQSTRGFDTSHYARGRGPGGPRGGGGGGPRPHHGPGANYVCRKCGIPGHYLSNCNSNGIAKAKRSSGIPRDFLVKVDAKEKGALLTPSGEYAMSRIDLEAYRNPKKEKAPFFEEGSPSVNISSDTSSKNTSH